MAVVPPNIAGFDAVLLGRALTEFTQFLQAAYDNHPTKLLYGPVISRVKDLESVKRKCAKDAKNWKQLSDYCGARLVVEPVCTPEAVFDVLQVLFPGIVAQVFPDPTDPTTFGYRALHVEILFAGTSLQVSQNLQNLGVISLKIEVQIRTVLADVWAKISHLEYEYVRLESLPGTKPVLPREFNAVAGALEVAELVLQMLHEKRNQNKNNNQRSSRNIAQMKDMIEFLQSHLPARKEQRLDWELKEMFGAIRASKKTSWTALDEAWNQFEKGERWTGSDVLDFGAYLYHKECSSRFPRDSYYFLYADSFKISEK